MSSPPPSTTSSTQRFRANEGDWICPDSQCGNVNFARRFSCNRCGKEKSTTPPKKQLGQEIGKAAAEKSRGLFSADDWQCGRCGNVNWARRSQCNMCNAPKFGEVEERTGLGGGYNERENVEYNQHEESDSEFDDFGRRKKKMRRDDDENHRETKTPDSLKTRKEAEKFSKVQPESEEEEEDDDEDGDLSKYDLSGWGDDETKKDDEMETKKKVEDSESDEESSRGKADHSRSRSRSPRSSRSSSSDSRSSDSGDSSN